MAKQRVLYISHGHPNIMAGGAEVYAYELYKGMQQSDKWEPFFLAYAKMAPHLGVPFRSIGDDPNQTLMTGGGYDYFYGALPNKDTYTRYFRDYLMKVRPQVVHFQHTLHLGYQMIQEVRRTLPDTKIVYTLHEYLPICNANGQMVRTRNADRCREASPQRCHECFPKKTPQQFFLREKFVRSHFALVDKFHAPSKFLMERYVDWGIPRDKILFLEYGRQVQKPVPHRKVIKGKPRNRFGFFGQLNKYKGILPLLQAMEILANREFEDVSLTVNGANLEIQPPPFPEQFKSLVERAGNLVNIAGPYQNEELDDRMESCDWVIIPSVWWENSPLVIQEAFMHKRPILVSNIGGMAEKVTDNVDGLHFQCGNPADLADTIERAATDPDLWERLVKGIRPVFEMADAVIEHEGLYSQLQTGGVAA